ncbi:unnamed protein product [Diabrotica balteata]|uniref:Neuroendocrine protein 7B2 n=1 Tax=Diabrotica balteata TaxID=107213 RepID=A0A9N9TAD7_DIABA|nr:unnamed protein product [Diabrotica balteata]
MLVLAFFSEHGCIEMFENTASFSRRYQASQNCMCDTEHMFECPTSNDISDDNSIDMFDGYHFNKMLQQSAKLKQLFMQKNLYAKKDLQIKVIGK